MTTEKIVGIVFLVLMIIDGLYMIKQIVGMACIADNVEHCKKRFIISFILMLVLGTASLIIKHLI